MLIVVMPYLLKSQWLLNLGRDFTVTMVYVNVLVYQQFSGPWIYVVDREEHVHVTGVTEVERERGRALSMTRSDILLISQSTIFFLIINTFDVSSSDIYDKYKEKRGNVR
jgi:hypothetical protein